MVNGRKKELLLALSQKNLSGENHKRHLALLLKRKKKNFLVCVYDSGERDEKISLVIS